MTAVAKASALRGGIENVLSRKIDGVPVAGTVKWLVTELTGKPAEAPQVRAVEAELKGMEADGLVTTRRMHRSGELLWKLTDEHHAAWQNLAGASLRANH